MNSGPLLQTLLGRWIERKPNLAHITGHIFRGAGTLGPSIDHAAGRECWYST